ncbi:hypothetical protein Q7P35_000100 [Cladosporium inversicolor]
MSSHLPSCREAGEDEAAGLAALAGRSEPTPTGDIKGREHRIPPSKTRAATQAASDHVMRAQQRTHAYMFMSTSASTARVAFDDSIDNGSGSPTTSGLDPSVPARKATQAKAKQALFSAARRFCELVSGGTCGHPTTRSVASALASVFSTTHTPD